MVMHDDLETTFMFTEKVRDNLLQNNNIDCFITNWLRLFSYPTKVLLDFFKCFQRRSILFESILRSGSHELLESFLRLFIDDLILSNLLNKFRLLQGMKRQERASLDANSLVIECIKIMIKSNFKYHPKYFFTLLDLVCPTCDSIYIAAYKSNPNDFHDRNDFFSHITHLHSILSNDLFIKLMVEKSDGCNPFSGGIEGKAWLARVIDAQLTSILSFIFKNRPNDVKRYIIGSGKNTTDLSKSLIDLLLNKTNNFTMLRREFLEILTSHLENSDDAIQFVKQNSSETSNVSLKCVQEIKEQYNYSKIEKIVIFSTLCVTFVLGTAFYFADIGADYSLLGDPSSEFELFNCSEKCNSFSSNHSNYENYWNYTFICILVPFILNFFLIGIECYRNGWECIPLLPFTIAKYNCKRRDPYFMDYYFKDRPFEYLMSILFTTFLWIPLVITFYPVATKLAFWYLEYKISVITRALTTSQRNDLSLNSSNDVFKKLSRTITSEMIKSSTLEVVTEATFQPMIQMYFLTGCKTFYDNMSLDSFYSNIQVRSVITSIASFAWSMTTYHVYTKRGALDFGIGLKARLVLLMYILLYISARVLILSTAAHEIFCTYDIFLGFIFYHFLVVSIIHIVHLKMLDINLNVISFDNWVEVLINGAGSILLPSNIKFPKKHTFNGSLDERYHEPTSFRYILMHSIIFIQNIVLAFWSWKTLPNTRFFTAYFPFITIGLLFCSLLCKFYYYQSHVWPIKATACCKKRFYYPRNEKSAENGTVNLLIDEKTDNHMIEGKYFFIYPFFTSKNKLAIIN